MTEGPDREGSAGCPHGRGAGTTFDHHDPSMSEAVLWPTYERLREEGRVAYSDRHGGFWILSHYDDIRSALRNPEVFSSASGHRIPEVPAARAIPIDYDPPEHTGYRQLMSKALIPQRVEEMHDFLRGTIRRLLREFHAQGGGDFIGEVALPLPLLVLTEVVGFSDSATSRFRELTDRIAATLTDNEAQLEAREQFRSVLRHEVEWHRRERPDDFLTGLLNATLDGRPLEEREILSVLNTLALAGHETTMNSAGHLFWLLATQPGLQRRIREDPSLANRYADEMWRLRTPAQMFARRVTEDVTIDGVTIPKGDRVLLLYASANRDTARFPNADQFDIERPSRGHLAFGWGIHQCMGAGLARVEMRMLLEESAQLPPVRLSGDPVFGHIETAAHYGLKRLPLAYGDTDDAKEPVQ